MAAPSATMPRTLGPVQEELEVDREGSRRFIDTIRRPFVGSLRWGNPTLKEGGERNSMERKQKTPSRTWLHRLAAKLTISRGTRGTIKSNAGEKGREAEKTSGRTGFQRKPIPSFAPPANDGDGQDKSDGVPSLSQSSSSHDAGTHGSTQRSSTSIRTPSSVEDCSADATTDQVWDFGEVGDNHSGQTKGQAEHGECPLLLGIRS